MEDMVSSSAVSPYTSEIWRTLHFMRAKFMSMLSLLVAGTVITAYDLVNVKSLLAMVRTSIPLAKSSWQPIIKIEGILSEPVSPHALIE